MLQNSNPATIHPEPTFTWIIDVVYDLIRFSESNKLQQTQLSLMTAFETIQNEITKQGTHFVESTDSDDPVNVVAFQRTVIQYPTKQT
ncbi:hypothetical protein [Shimia thalassica]|uniref:hypothetical protein n=1 Tax=Shimia thalassica TaxID=1715693 RepID=UPI0026E182C0|nr:hypothetical protein [Shimia thalassica]MDO6799720.1 hypothetical protein [Shimia thalassica]